MMSYNFNYGPFSNIAFDGGLNDRDILLEDPDMLVEDGELAFMSAVWYYMYPKSPMPSMHDAILGFFEPSQSDIDADICTECFGTTINIINGAECGQPNNSAEVRSQAFLEMCDDFGADCPVINVGCETMGSFSESSGVHIDEWLAKDPYDPNTCKVVSQNTGYSVYAEDDYKRCVCDSWAPGDLDCLPGVQDTDLSLRMLSQTSSFVAL